MLKVLTGPEVRKFNQMNKRASVMKVYNSHDHDGIFGINRKNEIRSIPGKDGGPARPVRLIVDPANDTGGEWEKSAACEELWERARHMSYKLKDHFKTVDKWKKNIEHMPDGTEELFDLMRLDITMRVRDIPDYVPFLCDEQYNEDFDDPTYVQWLYGYVAKMGVIQGTGDKVNQVWTQLGTKETFDFEIVGVGFQQDLYNKLFNKIFDMKKVNKAVAKAHVTRRNNNVFGPIIDFAYPTIKTIEDVDTAGFSLDQKYYDTMVHAITRMGHLLDFQTNSEIDITGGMTLITHTSQVFGWTRAISGNLQNGDQVKNLTSLMPWINRIIPINEKTEKYFEETLTYRGCNTDDNYSYLLVPKNNFYMVKRRLTHKTGPGDAFSLNSDKDVWYEVDAQYNDHFLGGDEDDKETSDDPTIMTQYHGYVIRIDNPPDSASTDNT